MADVFLSYAREDLHFVQRLSAALQANGRRVWVDLEGIPASAPWMDEIRNAIVDADAVVFVISPHSVRSEVCRKELSYAVECAKHIIPILLTPSVGDEMPPPLPELHWISLNDDDVDALVAQLISVLDTDLAGVRRHTRLLSQAKAWEEKGRDTSLLLRGAELRESENWLAEEAGHHPPATTAQTRLIMASRRAVTRRHRSFAIGGTSVAILMAILAVVALIQRQATTTAQRATIARSLTSQADRVRASDPRRALQFGVAATSLDSSPDVLASLRQSLVSTSGFRTLRGHTDNVHQVAFAPDGHTLASAGQDGTVRLWSVDARDRPLPLVR